MPDSIILRHFNFFICAGIAQDNTFYYVNPKRELIRMVRELYAGGLYYRIPRTSIRFSRNRVTKDMKQNRVNLNQNHPPNLPQGRLQRATASPLEGDEGVRRFFASQSLRSE